MSPGQGSFSVKHNSDGRISSWSGSHSGASAHQSEAFSYNSAGRVYAWSRTFSGSTPNQNVSVAYDGHGNVSNVSATGAGLGSVQASYCPAL